MTAVANVCFPKQIFVPTRDGSHNHVDENA